MGFVQVRNKVVHNNLKLDVLTIYESLLILEEMAKVTDLYSEAIFEEDQGVLSFQTPGHEKLVLYPFVIPGKSEEDGIVIPYIFQGLFEKKEIREKMLKFLGTGTGEIIEASQEDNEEIRKLFVEIGRDALGITNKAFNFQGLTNRYAECFVGRDKELNSLFDFCTKPTKNRYLSVYSPAGFGKSALLAALYNQPELKNQTIIHFCGAGERNNPMSAISSLLKQFKQVWQNQPKELDERQKRLPGNWDKLIQLFQETLEAYSPKANTNNLIVIIDGIDEAEVANPQVNFRDILFVKSKDGEEETIEPWEILENIRIIFGFREGKTNPTQSQNAKIESFALPILQPLGPLGEESVELAFTTKQIPITESVKKRIIEYGNVSNGIDPSFLRFVYDEIVSGKISPSNESAIPKGLSGLYARELKNPKERYEVREKNLRTITAFAIPNSSVSIDFLSQATGIDLEELQSIVETRSKWFNRDNRGRISLFHDRLRTATEQPTEPRVIASLCKFSLLCGRVGEESQTSVSEAFRMAEEGDLEGAVARVSVIQDEEKLFLAFLYLILINSKTDETIQGRNLEFILNKIEEQIVETISDLNFRSIWKFLIQQLFLHCNFYGNMDRFLNLLPLDTLNVDLILRSYLKRESKEESKNFIEQIAKMSDEDIKKAIKILVEFQEFGLAFRLQESIKEDKLSGLASILKGLILQKNHEKLKNEKFKRLKNILNYFPKKEEISLSAEVYIQMIQILENIEGFKNQGSLLKTITEMFGRNIEIQGETEIIESIIKLTENIEDYNDKDSILQSIVIPIVKKGEINRALQLVEKIQNYSTKNSALNNIAETLANRDAYEKALQVAESIQGFSEKNWALQEIAKLLAEKGELEKALRTTENIQDFDYKNVALQEIAKELTRKGEFEKALQIVESIKDYYCKNDALQEIAETLAKQNEFEKALEVAESIHNMEYNYKISAYQEIAKELGKSGDIPGKITFFERIIESLKEFNEVYDKSKLIKNLSQALVTSNYPDRIQAYFFTNTDWRIEIAKTITECQKAIFENTIGVKETEQATVEEKRYLLPYLYRSLLLQPFNREISHYGTLYTYFTHLGLNNKNVVEAIEKENKELVMKKEQ
ncbi:MAG: AAA family ATPase [Leptospiraceae bacterium]|nr:AAA family ATPase [Leptospiraceae bacterium]